MVSFRSFIMPLLALVTLSGAAANNVTSDDDLVKLVTVLRRKPYMTRKEFLDYHFQEHGKLSDEPTSLDEKPTKYRQYHIFDAAFGGPSVNASQTPNRNHNWVGRDDSAELYFRDMEHLLAVFSTDHVQTKVGPDALNFSDLDTSISWIGRETIVPINTTLPSCPVTRASDLDSNVITALYFVSVENITSSLADTLTTSFKSEIEAHAENDACALVVNKAPAAMEAPEESLKNFDLAAYFGGGSMPQYPLYFKVTLKDKSSTAAIRKAQIAFEAQAKNLGVDPTESIIAFSKQALVLDVDVPFDPARQPHLDDLE